MRTNVENRNSVDGIAIVAAMAAAFKMADKAGSEVSWLVQTRDRKPADGPGSLIHALDHLLLSDPKRAHDAVVQLAEAFPNVYRWHDDPKLRAEWIEFVTDPKGYTMPLENKIELARKYLEHITKHNFGDPEFYEALERYVSGINGHVGRIAQLMLMMHIQEAKTA
jgi:hypothetical protein